MTVDRGQGAAPHHDVASYALGVLGDPEATRFEEHLAGCEACARELESLLPVVDLLSDVRMSTVDMPPRPVEVPGDEVGLRRARRSGRRGARQHSPRWGVAARGALRRPAVAAAVAAVAAAGLTAGIAGTLGPERLTTEPGLSTAASSGPATGAPWDALRGPDLAKGQRLSASDPATGVHADVVIDRAAWGTRISFALSHLAGPQTCRLVAVRRGGGTEVLSTWVVPEQGYGTSAQSQPLVLQAATALARTDIGGLRVESVASSGVRTLVTIPA